MNRIQVMHAAMHAAGDQIKAAVRDGDVDAALAVVDRVEHEHGTAAAAAFDDGLRQTSLAGKLDG